MDSNNISLMMLITSLLSILGSLVVIFILLKNSDVRKKPINKILFYISISDLLGSLLCTYGLPPDGSTLCTAQGFFSNIFHLSSVFWTAVLTYGLYAIVVLRSPSPESYFQHAYCWILPLFLTCMIYTTNRIGIEKDDIIGWCFVASRSDSADWEARFWNFMAFNFWILLAALFMIYFMVRVRIELMKAALAIDNLTTAGKDVVAVTKQPEMVISRKKSKAFKLLGRQAKEFRILGIRDVFSHSHAAQHKDKTMKVWIYPCIVIISWTYFCIYDTVNNFNGDTPSALDFLLILPFLQGVFKGFAFYHLHPNFMALLCSPINNSLRPSTSRASSHPGEMSVFSIQSKVHGGSRKNPGISTNQAERRNHNWV